MTHAPHRRARRGFSLIELIITLVLVAIIGAAAGRMLMSQTRFYARLAGQRDARSVTRNARNIIQTELAMVPIDSGILGASNDSITVRMPYAWGVYCAASTMMRFPVDSQIYSMATLAGVAIKDTTATGVYTYNNTTTAPTAGTASNCLTTAGIIPPHRDSLSYVYLSFSTPAIAGVAGAPMFLYQKITYKFAASGLYPGRRGLFRQVGANTAEEILAPFDTSAKFRFYRLYADTAQTAVPSLTNIRGVEINLNAQSGTRASNRSNPESASIKTAIFFRNRNDS